MPRKIGAVEPKTGFVGQLQQQLGISAVDDWFDATSFPNLGGAIASIGLKEEATLVVSRPTVIGQPTLEVPPNITLQFLPGGAVGLHPGQTITIHGEIQAGLHQIFSGDGRVLLQGAKKGAKITCVLPQWFGAKADFDPDKLPFDPNNPQFTDNLGPFNKMIESLSEPGFLGFGSVGTHIIVTQGLYFFSDELSIYKSIRMTGATGLVHGSTRLIFADNKNGLVVEQSIPPVNGEQGAWSVIENLRLSPVTPFTEGGTNTRGNGIKLRARAKLVNLVIHGFGENGILADSSEQPPQGSPRYNANNCFFSNLRITNCGENGIKMEGSDSQAGVGIMIDVTDNRLCGILDSSFLGNTWIACHAQGNGECAYKTEGQDANYALFLGCYSELDQETSQFAGKSVIVGNNLPIQQAGAQDIIGYDRSRLVFGEINQQQHKIALIIPYNRHPSVTAAYLQQHGREGAKPTKVTLEFKKADPLVDALVPAGTEVETATGVRYITDAELAVPASLEAGTVSATSMDAGTRSHVDVQTLTIMPSPPANVASVRNTSGVKDGRGQVPLKVTAGPNGATLGAGTSIQFTTVGGGTVEYRTLSLLVLGPHEAQTVFSLALHDGPPGNLAVGDTPQLPLPTGVAAIDILSGIDVGSEGRIAWYWRYMDPDVHADDWRRGKWSWSYDDFVTTPFGFTGSEDPLYAPGQFFLGNSLASSQHATTESITQLVPGGGTAEYAFQGKYGVHPNEVFFMHVTSGDDFVASVEVVVVLPDAVAASAAASNVTRTAGYLDLNDKKYKVKITNNNPQDVEITAQLIAFRTHKVKA